MEENGLKLISDVEAIRDFCCKAIELQDQEKLFNKYRRGEHNKPKNKKAIKLVVGLVLEMSKGKAHSKVTQSVAKDLLDQYCIDYRNNKFLK